MHVHTRTMGGKVGRKEKRVASMSDGILSSAMLRPSHDQGVHYKVRSHRRTCVCVRMKGPTLRRIQVRTYYIVLSAGPFLGLTMLVLPVACHTAHLLDSVDTIELAGAGPHVVALGIWRARSYTRDRRHLNGWSCAAGKKSHET